ncbi:MAG: 1-acyl-sn-glycerol-3-phosphate acyltransferase [Chlorobi bacterium]|nr:1-acyl-sn-glycerol-3-phosphate acyltransferase [Chlorobiota bacterium]MBX7217115.1 1-acyl-sn-glycerol-3-phosphate acyltransferase [Candidatus Kapabacteria bacterium]
MRIVKSIWIWLSSVTLLTLWLIPVGVVRLLDRDPARYRTGRTLRRLAPILVAINPMWRLRTEGVLVGDPRRPYVAVSNHQSFADIPFISTLPWEMKWLAKAELFKVPVLGWLMRLVGDIMVDRQDRRRAAQSLVHAARYLQNHCSVFFFPEGTRSRDGRVGGFTDGAFLLAVRQGLPILPIAIDGSGDCLPKNTWLFGQPRTVRLSVLPPVRTEGLTTKDVGAIRQQVRQQIIGQIAAWRGVPAGDVDALLQNQPATTNESEQP